MPTPAVPTIDIESKGDEQTARLIAGMAKRGADPRPALRNIIEELRLKEDPWFRSHGGGSWPSLADETRAFKEQHGYPSDDRVRTGLMGASLTVRSGSNSIRRVWREGMRFGTSVRYAKFHRYGTGNMPQRDPVVPVDYLTRQRMVNDVKRYLLVGKLQGGTFVR